MNYVEYRLQLSRACVQTANAWQNTLLPDAREVLRKEDIELLAMSFEEVVNGIMDNLERILKDDTKT